MRALVLLCLLHVAFGQHLSYSWDGPGNAESDPDPNAGNACNMNQANCGCCLMQLEMNRLRKYFNTSLTILEEEVLKTQQIFNNIKGSRTAVSVALFSDEHFKCYGPFTVNSPIIYNYVFLNLGGSYSPETGIFTVPRSGVYSIALTVYSDAGAPGNTLAACASLQVNGQVVAGSTDRNINDQEDSATIVLVLHLKAGDRVAVNLPIGCFLCDDNSHYNTFTVFLLYATE